MSVSNGALNSVNLVAPQDILQSSIERTPATVNDIPPDVLGEVFKHCLPPLSARLSPRQPNPSMAPIILCHINAYWRAVALTESSLWNWLSHTATIIVDSYDEASTPMPMWQCFLKKDLEFLAWWADRVRGASLSLNLRIKFDKMLIRKGGKLGSVAKGPLAWTRGSGNLEPLVKLIASARYIDMDSGYISVLDGYFGAGKHWKPSDWSNVESFVLKRNRQKRYSGRSFTHRVIPFANMLALRKFCVVNCVIDDGLGISRLIQSIPCHITHLSMDVEMTLKAWRRFLGGCASLQAAQLILRIIEEEVGKENIDIDNHGCHTSRVSSQKRFSLPAMRELSLQCRYIQDDEDFKRVLDGISFPGLDTLLLKGNLLSMDGLHRVLCACPSIVRLRLSMGFPAINFTQLGPHATLHFPLTVHHAAHLASSVPGLKALMIDIPSIGYYTDSLVAYADEMAESEWLHGMKDLERVDFYWVWMQEQSAKWKAIKALKEHLEKQPDFLKMGGDKKVEVGVKVKYDTRDTDPESNEDAEYWEKWFDETECFSV